MRIPCLCAAALIVFPAALPAQEAARPSFEVASVKPSPAPAPGVYPRQQIRGGPGSSDPTTATFEFVDLASLVTMAYHIPRYALSGPQWLSSARFEITARIPPGTTADTYRVMLQDLLINRFGLATHHESRAMQSFDLVIDKNGPKIKQVAADPTAVPDGVQPPPAAPSPPRGFTGATAIAYPRASMERLAATLSGFLGAPVRDATGLTGDYEVKMRFTIAFDAPSDTASEPVPAIFDALREQLGLRLVKSNAPVNILVIDRIDRVPGGN